ncbi:DUF2341 domain-containing protein [Methanoculleus sp. FWC-SCC3]|uniref:DUF2341 domain-containing protein n=2 Tax=Methanoculleus methanifontis TaxID=2584086 RepID=A0ABT8LYT8_9EURY|nr:DUF2341 domain-containing protein [Methanoculleus sp. FWC-SCC3]
MDIGAGSHGGRITMGAIWIVLIGGGAALLLAAGTGAAADLPHPAVPVAPDVTPRYWSADDTAGVFAHRQTISVENPSDVDGLAVSFNATYLPGMRPDFADIRFTGADGTPVPYWIENVTAGSHARVWLALPANATAVTMLYGNPEARDAGDPDAVFLFFEDYERGNLSRWSFCGSNALVQSDIVRDGAYAGDINVSEPDLRHLANNRICLANISAGPLVIEGDFRVSEFGKWCGSGYIQAWNGTDHLYALHLRNGSVQHYDGVHRNFSADAPAGTDTWYHVRVVLDTPNATEHAWMDGEYLGSAPMRFSDGSPVPEDVIFDDFALIGSSAWYSGDPHHFYADNVVVRRYEPATPVLSYG